MLYKNKRNYLINGLVPISCRYTIAEAAEFTCSPSRRAYKSCGCK